MRISDWSSDVCSSDLLSALYDGDGKADNIAMVRARLSADAELMQRILSSEGFYDGRVDTRIERTPVAGDTVTDAAGAEGRRRGRRGPVIAVVDVAPGQRYSFASIDIQADPTLPPALIADAFPLAA